MGSLMSFWYSWGVFAGVFVTAAITIYIYFDSEQNNLSHIRTAPLVVAVVGFVMTLPGLYYMITVVQPALSNPLTLFNVIQNYSSIVNAGYIGVFGLALSLIALGYYVTQVKNRQESFYPSATTTRHAGGTTAAPPPLPPAGAPPPPPPPVHQPVRSVERPALPTQPINPEPAPKAWLVISRGPGAGRQFGLSTQRLNTIGRDARQADLVLEDSTVSREHARVRFENGRFVIVDLASTSGTLVNGSSVQRQMLYDNDRVQIGGVELLFKSAF